MFIDIKCTTLIVCSALRHLADVMMIMMMTMMVVMLVTMHNRRLLFLLTFAMMLTRRVLTALFGAAARSRRCVEVRTRMVINMIRGSKRIDSKVEILWRAELLVSHFNLMTWPLLMAMCVFDTHVLLAINWFTPLVNPILNSTHVGVVITPRCRVTIPRPGL